MNVSTTLLDFCAERGILSLQRAVDQAGAARIGEIGDEPFGENGESIPDSRRGTRCGRSTRRAMQKVR